MDSRGGGKKGGNSNTNNKAPRNRGGKKKRSRCRGKGDSARKKNSNKNNNKSNRKGGPPAPPQTKIVIRNIRDASKYGTVEAMVGLIRSIIDGANPKLATLSGCLNRIVEFDEVAAEYLIQEEEAVRKALEVAEKKKAEAEKAQDEEGEKGEDDNDDEKQDGNTAEAKEEKESNKHSAETPTQDAPSVAPSVATTEGPTTNLRARLNYVVPPKQTHRRGIKPGCAYLIISGPRIEEKQPPIPPCVPEQPKEEDKEVEDEKSSHNTDEPKLLNKTSEKPEAKETHHVTIAEPPTKQAALPSVDYSREVAKGRFLVTQAIEALQAHTQEDAKADQKYAGSQVEIALSGKTYKNNPGGVRRDRREGTLETSADYKAFMEKQAKEKEERMNRPKPAPGGGAVAVTVVATAGVPGTTTDPVESMPVAALVEHIRQKRMEQDKRKKASKKKNKDANKEKISNKAKSTKSKKKGKDSGGATKEGGGKKAGTREGKKSKRGGKKKNTKGANGSAAAAGPTPTLLKPGSDPPIIAKPPGNGGA